MKNIAIIPARSGSKGLKNKNIKSLCGMPLIGYSIKAAKETGLFDTIMVSTDSDKYAEIARSLGAEVPFLRSEDLSSDSAGSWDVVTDVLKRYREEGQLFDTVCLLQPTSPLRRSEDILACYNELMDKGADAITTVCEMDHSPLWSMVLDEHHSLNEFRKGCKEVPRQSLQTYYRINGAVYIRKIEYTEERIVLLSKKEYAYIMDRKSSIDIDSLDDFKYAEFLMRQR